VNETRTNFQPLRIGVPATGTLAIGLRGPSSVAYGFRIVCECGAARKTDQWRTGSPGARSNGGCGLANPVVPGRASTLALRVSTVLSVRNIAAMIAIVAARAMAARAVRRRSFSITSPPTQTNNVLYTAERVPGGAGRLHAHPVDLGHRPRRGRGLPRDAGRSK
jgi:hypothetical protein